MRTVFFDFASPGETVEQKQPAAIQRKDLERVRAKLTAHVKAQRGTK